LQAIVNAHQRIAAPDCPPLPAFAVPDLDQLELADLTEWARPEQGGRVRAFAFSRCLVMFGPDLTETALRAAGRGQLSPTIMHEVLHCLPAHGRLQRLKTPLMEHDFAWSEGGQQAWAEALCAQSTDPITGLSGGTEHTCVYIGWKYSVRALAEHLDRPLLEVARQLGQAAVGQSLALVAQWLYGNNELTALEQVTEQFGRLFDQAYELRFCQGTGPATYRAVVDILDKDTAANTS
jgi:hypothetical protein